MPENKHVKQPKNIESKSINEISKRTAFNQVTIRRFRIQI